MIDLTYAIFTLDGHTYWVQLGLMRVVEMEKFKITYRDPDPASPDFTMTVMAEDREHAEIRFWENGDPNDDDWTIVSIRKASK